MFMEGIGWPAALVAAWLVAGIGRTRSVSTDIRVSLTLWNHEGRVHGKFRSAIGARLRSVRIGSGTTDIWHSCPTSFSKRSRQLGDGNSARVWSRNLSRCRRVSDGGIGDGTLSLQHGGRLCGRHDAVDVVIWVLRCQGMAKGLAHGATLTIFLSPAMGSSSPASGRPSMPGIRAKGIKG